LEPRPRTKFRDCIPTSESGESFGATRPIREEYYFFRLVVFFDDFLVAFFAFLAMRVTSFHYDKSKYLKKARQRFFAFSEFFLPLR